MISTLIAKLRKSRDDRRRYNRAIAEIESLTQRELTDLNADPVEMARAVYANIYGKAA